MSLKTFDYVVAAIALALLASNASGVTAPGNFIAGAGFVLLGGIVLVVLLGWIISLLRP